MPAPPPTLGVILAGGLARRMGGGDKGLRLLAGRPLLAHVAARLAPQVARLVLNANGDPARFAALGLPVVADPLPDQPGPLVGLLAGFECAARIGLDWVVTAPGDAPFLPTDLVARLHAERGAARCACAASGGRAHPVVALWPLVARASLHAALRGGTRRVGDFAAALGCAEVAWPVAAVDPFLNVNTPADLALAERIAGGGA